MIDKMTSIENPSFSLIEESLEGFFNLRLPKKPLKLLIEPSDDTSALAVNNLGYQMQGSVALLEERLAEEGNPHVLQLNLQWEGDDWRAQRHGASMPME